MTHGGATVNEAIRSGITSHNVKRHQPSSYLLHLTSWPPSLDLPCPLLAAPHLPPPPLCVQLVEKVVIRIGQVIPHKAWEEEDLIKLTLGLLGLDQVGKTGPGRGACRQDMIVGAGSS